MRKLPVDTSLDVLNVFYARKGQDLWVNEIVRRVTETTGSKDNPAIKDSIGFLERASVIKTVSSSNHKQKEIKIPTLLGEEVINLIDHLKSCKYSYTRLKDAIVENNVRIGKTVNSDQDAEEVEKILNRKLLSKGWDHTETSRYLDIMRTAFRMETIYRSSIFNSILHRYSVIRAKFEVNVAADKIIQKIMMNEIQSLFLLAQDLEKRSSEFSYGRHYFNPETSDYRDIPFVDLYDLILQELEDYYHEGALLINKPISNAIEGVTLSLLLLLQSDEEEVRQYIKDLQISRKKQQEKILASIKKKDRGSYLVEELSLVKLRDIYLRYLEIKQKPRYSR